MQAHSYDQAGRLIDPGVVYDPVGDITSLRGSDAGGEAISSSFFVDGQLAEQTQGETAHSYLLDPEGRTMITSSYAVNKESLERTLSSEVESHYAGGGGAPAWSYDRTNATWSRQITGFDGLVAVQEGNVAEAKQPVLQLSDMQGNIVETASLNSEATEPLSKERSTEFGVPVTGKPVDKYKWLGGSGLTSSFEGSGAVAQDGSTYIPQTGESLQTAPSPPPIPINKATPYVSTTVPWVAAGTAAAAAKETALYEEAQRKTEEASAPVGVIPEPEGIEAYVSYDFKPLHPGGGGCSGTNACAARAKERVECYSKVLVGGTESNVWARGWGWCPGILPRLANGLRTWSYVAVSREDRRSLSGEAQAAIRDRAVRAVLDGQSHREVARTLGVERAVVSKWMRRWRDGGWEGLKERRRGRRPGEQPALQPWQQGVIVKLIKEKNPSQLQLPGFLWTRDAVAELIERKFGVHLAVTTVGRYLRSWGLTPQVPAHRAFERDPEAVGQWLEDTYPKIVRKAQRQKALILWQDETGFRSQCSHGRSWSPKGQTPVVEGTGQRFGTNASFAIGNDGSLRFMLFDGNFNQCVFIEFLELLLKHHPDRKIFLIVDGHPSHRSKLVKQWVAEHCERIELHFLPGYSPQLNPVELLNHDVKANAVGRKRARTLAELKENVTSYLTGRQKQPHILKRFFTHPDTAYAAA